MRNSLKLIATASVILLSACSKPDISPVAFENVSEAAGLSSMIGMTFGAAWGDFDGDRLPDLYVTNHLNEPKLFRNLGNGRFEDVTLRYFNPEDIAGDSHGAAWADVNNNGMLDLIQLTGAVVGVGKEPKRLFFNQGDRFIDEAEAMGVINLEGRTRMPLWLDLDGDGKLDLIQGAEARFDDVTPPFTFLQQGSRFEKAMELLSFRSRSVPFCIVTQLVDDGHPELVCRVAGQNLTSQIFSTASQPPRELDWLPITAFEDIAAGDFDNNGRIDLFLARRNPSGRIAFGRPADEHLIADFSINRTDFPSETGFEFHAQGPLQIKLLPHRPRGWLTPAQIRFGSDAKTMDKLEFELTPELASGMASSASDARGEIRVGFQAPDRWQVRVFPPNENNGELPRNVQVQLSIQATSTIRGLKATSGAENPEHAPQRLFMNRGDKLVEESEKRGLNKIPIAAMNVVAADFNNDMHLDLFILGSGDAGMHDSVLMLNKGNGHFEAVPVGAGITPRAGVGDSVTTVDFDGDGFIDLLIATGGSMGRSLGLPSDGGSYSLLRNQGNANNWLQIDLEGTRSNRDGIGARVEVSTDKITQTRIQDGGIHHRGQNHSRLHFGLAQHQTVSTVVVKWPSGTTQTLQDVPANQILRIIEPAQ